MSGQRPFLGSHALVSTLVLLVELPSTCAHGVGNGSSWNHYESSLWATPAMNVSNYACLYEKGFVTHVSIEGFFYLPLDGNSAPVVARRDDIVFEGRSLAPWSNWTAAVKEHYPNFHIGAMLGPVLEKDDPQALSVSRLVEHGDQAIETIVAAAVAGQLDSVDLDIECKYVDGLPEWIVRLAGRLRAHDIDLTSTECYGSCQTLLDGGVQSVVFMIYNDNFADFRSNAETMLDIVNPYGATTGPNAWGVGLATWWGTLNATDFEAVSQWFSSRPATQRQWWHWGLDTTCCSHETQRLLYSARFGSDPTDFCHEPPKDHQRLAVV